MSISLRHRGDAAGHRRQRQERRGRCCATTPFLVISGDALTDIDLTELVAVPPREGRAGHGLPHPGARTRWSSASRSSTRRAGWSASWRSRPGARSSPTPSTPASTSWSPRSSTTSPSGEAVDWSADVFPRAAGGGPADLRLRRRGLLGGRRHPRELPPGAGRRARSGKVDVDIDGFEVSPGVWVAEGAEVAPGRDPAAARSTSATTPRSRPAPSCASTPCSAATSS